MSQQTNNKQNDWNRNCPTAREEMREKYKWWWRERMRWWRERQELEDSCWSVYSKDIPLLQMFSSTQRKMEREREREGQGWRRMWVIGGLAEFARLDSSWCVLWLALSKGFMVSNRQSVVGMPCHGIRQETPGSTVTNHIPTYHLQKQKWIWSANLKVINSCPHAEKWFSALLLLTLPHGALISGYNSRFCDLGDFAGSGLFVSCLACQKEEA